MGSLRLTGMLTIEEKLPLQARCVLLLQYGIFERTTLIFQSDLKVNGHVFNLLTPLTHNEVQRN